MKTVLIINPVAGGKDVTEAVRAAMSAAARKVGLAAEDWEAVVTAHEGHATELAEQYAQSGRPVRLLAVGGDGTFNEVLRGAYRYANAAVGCVPYGSGNDFLRNFGTKEEFLNLEDQLKGEEIRIDLLETDCGVGADICSVGLDAQIAYNIPKYRRLPLCGGSTAYKLSIVEQLLHPLGRKLEITVDGQTAQGEFLLAAICNGGWYGGGFHAVPDCDLQDGVLEIVAVRKMNLLRIAKVLPMYQKGLHMENGEIVAGIRDVVELYRGKNISVRILDDPSRPVIINVDGECRPAQSFSVKILPLAGRILLPGTVFARHQAGNAALSSAEKPTLV